MFIRKGTQSLLGKAGVHSHVHPERAHVGTALTLPLEHNDCLGLNGQDGEQEVLGVDETGSGTSARHCCDMNVLTGTINTATETSTITPEAAKVEPAAGESRR